MPKVVSLFSQAFPVAETPGLKPALKQFVIWTPLSRPQSSSPLYIQPSPTLIKTRMKEIPTLLQTP